MIQKTKKIEMNKDEMNKFYQHDRVAVRQLLESASTLRHKYD